MKICIHFWKHFQHLFTVNVWVEVIGDLFIGPYKLLPRLSGTYHLTFFDGKITSTAGGGTVGNTTYSVVYA
jgi:hypothetical protein